MFVWHSAHDLSPTKWAPGTSGAELSVKGVVAQEISTKATVAQRPKPAAPARYRPGLFFAGLPVTNHVSVRGGVRFLSIRSNQSGLSRGILHHSAKIRLGVGKWFCANGVASTNYHHYLWAGHKKHGGMKAPLAQAAFCVKLVEGNIF